MFFLAQRFWLCVILLIFFLIFSFLHYRKTYPPLKNIQKIFLLTLRSVAFLTLFLALSEAVFAFFKVELKKPVVAFLLDSSKSMNFKSEKTTRKKLLEELIGSEEIKKLWEKAELKAYTFSDTLTSLDLKKDEIDFSGEVTSLGNALENVKEKLKDFNLNAVFVLSDGANNYGKDPIEVAKNLGIPIYACGIGETTPTFDLSINEVTHPDIAYSGEKTEIEVFVTGEGFEGKKLPLFLKEGKEILNQLEIEIPPSGLTQKFKFEIVPQKEGLFQYDIILPVQEGESNQKNNKRSIFLKVLKSKLKLFIIASRLDWEYTFSRRFFESDENFEVKTLVYGKNQIPLIGDLLEKEKFSDFDVLIFVDIPATIFKRYKTKVIDFLNEKKSALFLLGNEFYKGRDFGEFSGVLPFDFKEISFLPHNILLKLTPDGRFHPVTSLEKDPFENAKVWANQPPFLGIIKIKDVSKKAKVLAFYSPIEGEVVPGIVIKKNKGKVMAVTCFPFWRWDFFLWGVGKDNRYYKNFFKNSIRWLTTEEDVEKVQIKSDKIVYKSGERISFVAKIFDENYQKITLADVSLNIIPFGKSLDQKTLALDLTLDKNLNYTGSVTSLPPGKYSFLGEVKLDDKVFGTKKGEFTVEQFSLEDQNPNPDKDLLKKIAVISKGKYYELKDFTLSDLELEEKEEKKEIKINLWTSPYLLLIVIACLSVEWAIRRRLQLP